MQKDSLLTTVDILKAERDSIYYENNNLKSQNSKLESLSHELTLNQNELNLLIKNITYSVNTKQKEFITLFDKYSKLRDDKILLAKKNERTRRSNLSSIRI